MPGPCPTCCTLGGRDRRTLYITTGRIRMTEDELAALPSAGGLYAVDLPPHHAPGIIEPRYAG
jgi:L-arabinonolactonase